MLCSNFSLHDWVLVITNLKLYLQFDHFGLLWSGLDEKFSYQICPIIWLMLSQITAMLILSIRIGCSNLSTNQNA